MLSTLVLAWALALVQLGPYSASSNFSVDIAGTADTRPNTWGTAGYQTWSMPFHPPAGYRVRILSLKGDLTSWPKVLPGDPPIAPGLLAGVLLGFSTTGPEGSLRCTPCADNTPLYVQSIAGVVREFSYSVDALLEPDNTLIVKVATFLNVTGHPIHMEPTVTVTFEFVPNQSS